MGLQTKKIKTSYWKKQGDMQMFVVKLFRWKVGMSQKKGRSLPGDVFFPSCPTKMLSKLATPLSQKRVAHFSLLSYPTALHFSSQSSFFTVMPFSQAISSCVIPSLVSMMQSLPQVSDHSYSYLRDTLPELGQRILSWEHHSGLWPSQTKPDVTQIKKKGKRCELEILNFLPLYARAKSLSNWPCSELSVGTDKAMEVRLGSPFVLSLQCWILVRYSQGNLLLTG